MRQIERKIIGSLASVLLAIFCVAETAYGQEALPALVPERKVFPFMEDMSPMYELAADTSAIAKSFVLSPDILLRGNMAGVRVFATDGNPTGAVTTHIRGANSVRGNSDPLWIVDGVMLNPQQLDVRPLFWMDADDDYTAPQNTLLAINPEDIESIEVIRDLSASAIYGARGANGVVLIRTRQARVGDKFRILWNSNVSFLTPVKNGTEMLGLADYADYRQQVGDDVSALGNEVSWSDRMLRTSVSHNHNLAVSGSSNRARYYVSGNIRRIDGVLPRNDSWTAGFRFNFDMRANKLFSFGARVLIGYSDLNMTKGTSMLGTPSLTTSLLTAPPSLDAQFSPEGWKNDYDDNSQEYRMMPTMYFTFNILRGLRLDANLGIDYRAKDRLGWFGSDTWYGRRSDENVKGGAASISSLQAFQFNSRIQLAYNTVFADRHRISARGGVEFWSNRKQFNNLNGKGFDIYDLRAKGVRGAASKPYPHSYDITHNQFGFFAGAGYEFGSIAGIDVMARADRTKKYEDSFQLYPAVNLRWNLRNTFMPHSKILSDLTLRGGWGKAAQETVSPFDFYGAYYSGSAMEMPPEQGVHPFFDMFSRITSEEYNAALDIGLLDDRIRLSAGFYSKETTDRFSVFRFGDNRLSDFSTSRYWFYTDRSLWHTTQTTFSGKGLEFDVRASIIDTSDWKWDAAINLATWKGEVRSVDADDAYGISLGGGKAGFANVNEVGQAPNSLYGFRKAGIVTEGNIANAPMFFGQAAAVGDVLYNSSGNDVNYDDRAVIGNPHPSLWGGFSTGVKYRRLALDIALDWAAGHDILNLDRMLTDDVSATGNISRAAYLSAIEAGGSTSPSSPRFGAAGLGVISDAYIEKGDFLRISDIRFTYDIPLNKVSWIHSIKVWFNIGNALVLTGYDGWNPDLNSFGTNNARLGIAYGGFPQARSFTLGVNASF